MMFTSRPKPEAVDELIVHWTPAWNAKSLCGKGYGSSSLAGIHHEPRGMRSEKAHHHPQTMAAARREAS